jgi:Uma2 family endonuclease
MNAMTQPRLSLEAYLAWENAEIERHEFYRGEVFAMVGARRSHNCVVANLNRHLGNHLAGTACRAFAETLKLRIADDTVLYPDLMISCDKQDLRADMWLLAPIVVVEVLSPSTQSYDRSQKFALYRRITALQEYVLVDPDTRRVEAFRRNAQGQWVLDDMSDSGSLRMPSVDAQVSFTDLFDGVDPPDAEPAQVSA